ncbi:MAG: hypothetical protein ICV81_20545 [Flavisolibacter sp.]|nr:hypothetical protein [Flavisolibacter sp.]
MEQSNIKRCTSFFSFALEWNSGTYSLEQLMAKVHEWSLGPGIELVGFQSLRGYPNLPDAEVNNVKRIIEKYSLEPVCLDADLDVAIRRGRTFNDDESVAYLVPQVELAKKLGFPLLHLSASVNAAVLRKLLPVAEKAGVRLGVEIQGLLHVRHPAVLALRELFHKLNSPFLGFVADFSTSMRNIPDSLLNNLLEAGVTDELIALTKEIWKKDLPTPAKFGELQERASALGATPLQIEALNTAIIMNGRQSVEAWKEIVPQTVHLHGKFYGIDESGEEPSIDNAGIIKVFYEGGYKGYLSSEFRRIACCDQSTGFEQVYRHQKLCSGILEKLEAHKQIKTSHKQINTV